MTHEVAPVAPPLTRFGSTPAPADPPDEDVAVHIQQQVIWM
jgi:hypothetical protein